MGVYKYLQKTYGPCFPTTFEERIEDYRNCSDQRFFLTRGVFQSFKSYYQLPPRQYRIQFKNFLGESKMCETKINGWLLSGNNFDKYEVTIDQMNFHSGNQSVK